MQKTIRQAVGILCFLIVAFAVFRIANDILRIKVCDESDMIHSFYDVEENTLDVLCIGSSHAYRSFQPNLLWGEYGIPSYVMGSPGQSAICSYYLLREALQYQKPKVVLFETFYLREERKFRTEERLRQAVDGMRLGKNKAEMLDHIFPKYSWKEKLPFYIPFLMYHNRWDSLKNTDFNQFVWLKGGSLDYTRVPQIKPFFPEKPRKIPKISKKYLKKIVRLCEENGILLVLFAAPMAESDIVKESLRINLSVEKFAAKREIPFLFYQKTGELNINYWTDFYDDEHLNMYGAEKATKKLGEWLVRNCGLADRRQEEAYAAWNEDYLRYEKLAGEMKEAAREEGGE